MNEHYPFELTSMNKLGEQLLACKNSWDTIGVLAEACGMKVAQHLETLLCQLICKEREDATHYNED